ncbi:hypothetical protein HZB02_00520, partial [Candidatus Woesearchaeota archaeon]|nr:hypothetical protein [Candidatus Woesearchaeota archaeon]
MTKINGVLLSFLFLLLLSGVQAATVVMQPNPATPDQDITCSLAGAPSAHFDYYWFKNGYQIYTDAQGRSSSLLPASYTEVGDTIACKVYTANTWNHVGTGFAIICDDRNANSICDNLEPSGAYDAGEVTNTLPDRMEACSQANVAITMLNTGTFDWRAEDQIKLGAVGDSDPFSSSRVDLNAHEVIQPTQQKTFTMTFTAPAQISTYLSDWQMLKEGDHSFGDVVAKNIQVVDTVKPTTPVISSPTHQNNVPSTNNNVTLQWSSSDCSGIRGYS